MIGLFWKGDGTTVLGLTDFNMTAKFCQAPPYPKARRQRNSERSTRSLKSPSANCFNKFWKVSNFTGSSHDTMRKNALRLSAKQVKLERDVASLLCSAQGWEVLGGRNWSISPSLGIHQKT